MAAGKPSSALFVPALSIPFAVILSAMTALGAAWVANAKTQAEMGIRMDVTDKKVELLQNQMRNFVPGPEFAMAIADMKRELDGIRDDVKEIRREVHH